MNEHAIFHMPDSAYCFPVSKKRITLRLRAAKGDISEAWVIYESKYVIAQKQSRRQMTKKFTGRLYDYYSVTLDLEDTRIGYVFYIRIGEDYYFFSEDGLTRTYDYSSGYYNFSSIRISMRQTSFTECHGPAMRCFIRSLWIASMQAT